MYFRRGSYALMTAFLLATTAWSAERFAGPWNLEALRQVPQATWGEPTEPAEGIQLQEVYYAGEPYLGQPTRVFAYFARPKNPAEALPGMVLVHGGAARRFPNGPSYGPSEVTPPWP